jgi:hypothetical protein
MAVPMWPRPMNPTEIGFAEPIPTLCEDASPAELERSSYVSFAMSMPLQREINGDLTDIARWSRAVPSIRFNHVATTAERHFSCFAVLGLFLRRTSVVD